MSKAHYIREWRRFRGFTMERLAEHLSMSKAVISRIETGAQRYNQDFLEAIAEALQCRPGDLLLRDPYAAADEDRELAERIARAIRRDAP